jgi:peptidoglycan/LPS O-acetylase OafA/YrhL
MSTTEAKAGVISLDQPSLDSIDNVDKNTERKPTPARIEFIDFARGICALWVMIAHSYSFRYGDAIPKDQLLPNILSSNVHEAVTAFICLSGFSLFIPIARNGCVMRESIWQYFASRALRILPTYYAALAVGAVITARLQPLPHHLFSNELKDHILLLQDFNADAVNIVPPMWSIAVEWHIYFFLPLLVYCFKRYGILRTSLGSVVAADSAICLFQRPFMYFNYYALFALGGAGAIIAYSNMDFATRFRSWPWAKLSLLALILYFLRILLTDGDFQFGLGVCAALVAAALYAKPVVYPRPIVWIGSWSYSLYLIHWPILIVALHAVHKTTALLILGPLASLVGAYIFFLLFEQPFTLLRKKLFSKKSVTPIPMAA